MTGFCEACKEEVEIQDPWFTPDHRVSGQGTVHGPCPNADCGTTVTKLQVKASDFFRENPDA